jgi:magnesium-transporting ATPase (P-type)
MSSSFSSSQNSNKKHRNKSKENHKDSNHEQPSPTKDRDTAKSDGLTDAEAKKALEENGPNEIEEKKIPLWKQFLLNFWGPLQWMVEAAVLLALINACIENGEAWVDFTVLLIMLLINGIVGFIEDHRCELVCGGFISVSDVFVVVPTKLVNMFVYASIAYN